MLLMATGLLARLMHGSVFFVSAEGTDRARSHWSVKGSQEMLAGAWQRKLHKRHRIHYNKELAKGEKVERIHITV